MNLNTTGSSRIQMFSYFLLLSIVAVGTSSSTDCIIMMIAPLIQRRATLSEGESAQRLQLMDRAGMFHASPPACLV